VPFYHLPVILILYPLYNKCLLLIFVGLGSRVVTWVDLFAGVAFAPIWVGSISCGDPSQWQMFSTVVLLAGVHDILEARRV
jgi:hypothetical protein